MFECVKQARRLVMRSKKCENGNKEALIFIIKLSCIYATSTQWQTFLYVYQTYDIEK